MGEISKFGSFAVTDPHAGLAGARHAWARIVAAWPERDVAEPGLAKIAVADIERILSKIPMSDLGRAVERFLGGEVGNPQYPPKLAELAAEARRLSAADAAQVKARRALESPRALPQPERGPEELARRRALADEARKTIAAARLPTIADAIRPRRPPPEPQHERPAPDAPAADHEAHARALAALPLPRLSPHAAEIVRRQMRSAG